MGETMFEKERPKKQLSDKQMKALAAGRKKLKEKRVDSTTATHAENDITIKTRQREERHERKKVLDEKREIDIYNKLMAKGNKKIENFKQMKYNWLDKAVDMKEYTQFKDILDTITEDDILHDRHIDKLKDRQRELNKSPTPEPENEPENDLDNVVDVF